VREERPRAGVKKIVKMRLEDWKVLVNKRMKESPVRQLKACSM
jgi:hypothetical protein